VDSQADSERPVDSVKYFDRLYLAEFRKVHSIAKRIITSRLSRKDKHLRGLVDLVLDHQSPTEYPFLFRHSYGEIEHSDGLDTIASAIHLLQTSTFVIDDIFDAGGIRDRKRTLFERAGVNYALVVGEILQTAATQTIDIELGRGNFSNKWLVSGMLHGMIQKVYLGQYLDIHNSSNPGITVRDYTRVISLTTGQFLSDIARCGALLAGRSSSEIDGLGEYAFKYGMALQVTDDIVDIVAPSHFTGKSFASDLRCRRMRLPLILALTMTDRTGVKSLKAFLGKAVPSDKEIEAVVSVIRKCGAVEACIDVAKRYIRQSLSSLALLPRNESTARLQWLVTRLLEAQALDR
jgi:geranylgeranyl pyrophosphate synthase